MDQKADGDPLISVVMPAYNNARYIEESIASVLNQTYENLELIVVDDGSEDDTKSVVEKLKKNDSRINYIKTINSGSPTARNEGFKLCRGEYIAVLDSDDIWPQDKLEIQHGILHEHGEGIVIGNVKRFSVDENGEKVWGDTSVLPEPGDNYVNNLLLLDIEQMVNFNTMLANAEIIIKYGFWDPRFRTAHDWEVWIRLANSFRFFHVNKTLEFYRKHRKSSTSRYSAKLEIKYQLLVIDTHAKKTNIKCFMFWLKARRVKHIQAIEIFIWEKRIFDALLYYLKGLFSSDLILTTESLTAPWQIMRLIFNRAKIGG